MSRGYVEAVNGLRAEIARAEARLLRRALKRRGYRGVERLDLAALVRDRGVRGAQRAALYYSNVLWEAATPGFIELAMALYLKTRCERRYAERGWFAQASSRAPIAEGLHAAG